MIAISSSIPALPLGAVDTASAIVIAMVVGAVVLVFWASRPSVIARYASKSQSPGDAPGPGSGDRPA